MRSPKLFHARPSFFTRRSTPLIVFTSIAIGLAGFLFGLSAIIFPGLRLSGRTCLTNSPPKTVRVVWDVAGNRIGNGATGEVKRHKVMGFVGIQTGFRSFGRRRALRNTWMPSDPEGLRRYWFYLLSNLNLSLLGFSGNDWTIASSKIGFDLDLNSVPYIGIWWLIIMLNLKDLEPMKLNIALFWVHTLITFEALSSMLDESCDFHYFSWNTTALCSLEESTGLAIRFVIGKTKDVAKMAELRREIAEYDDFILLDIEEEYSKLPYKTLVRETNTSLCTSYFDRWHEKLWSVVFLYLYFCCCSCIVWLSLKLHTPYMIQNSMSKLMMIYIWGQVIDRILCFCTLIRV